CVWVHVGQELALLVAEGSGALRPSTRRTRGAHEGHERRTRGLQKACKQWRAWLQCPIVPRSLITAACVLFGRTWLVPVWAGLFLELCWLPLAGAFHFGALRGDRRPGVINSGFKVWFPKVRSCLKPCIPCSASLSRLLAQPERSSTGPRLTSSG